MSNFLIALLFGAGAAAWIYSKLMKSTGGRTKDSLLAAGGIGLLVVLVVWFLLGMLLPS